MAQNNPVYSGKFVTFEGIDYSGKSVQSKILYQKLVDHQIDTLLLRDPGATAISERIRDILLDKKNHEMSVWTELLLYEAARAQMVQEAIIPALTAGKVVICDRFYDSTTAYQGYGRQLDLATVSRANLLGACGVTPDLTYIIDLDVNTAIKRRQELNEKADRLEAESPEFQNRVRDGYLSIAKKESHRIFLLKGERSIEKLSQEIYNIFNNRFKLVE
ncbi:dTMP kinase [candidate division KSB1 bacterium]|nr:dTMP kinase [candidate division KSB1 bacterium]